MKRRPARCAFASLAATLLLCASARADDTADADARVTIHLRADDPRAVLEHRPQALDGRGDLAGVDGWRAVCVAPCEATIPRRDRVRVAGSDIDPMEIVPEGPGSYDVFARTGSADEETAGLTLVIVGAVMLAGGGIGVGVSLDTDFSWQAEADTAGPVAFTASLSSMIAGGILFGIGAALRFDSLGELDVTPVKPAIALGDGVALTPAGLTF